MSLILKRNSPQVLNITLSGDYTGASLLFTGAISQYATADRIIDKDDDSITKALSGTDTVISITLLAADTAGLNQGLYCDLRKSDNTLLWTQFIPLEKGVRDPNNGSATVTTAQRYIAAETGTATDLYLQWNNTTKQYEALDIEAFNIATKGYHKEYVALLTQSGTNAPTATIIRNTLGFVPTLSYSGAGNYRLNFPEAQNLDKIVTAFSITRLYDYDGGENVFTYDIFKQNSSYLQIVTRSDNVLTNGLLLDISMYRNVISIKIYP